MSKTVRCDRCRRRARGSANAWNVTMDRGVIIGHTCPACQTAEENAEAEINEATLEYLGRIPGVGFVARPRMCGAE